MDDFMWGLGMMGIGMGVVFALLIVLMLVLLVIGRLDPQPKPAAEPLPTRAETSTNAEEAGADGAGAADDAAATPRGLEILHDGLTADQMTAIALAVITHAHIRRGQAAPEVRTFAPGSQLHASRWVQAGRTGQNAAWRRK